MRQTMSKHVFHASREVRNKSEPIPVAEIVNVATDYPTDHARKPKCTLWQKGFSDTHGVDKLTNIQSLKFYHNKICMIASRTKAVKLCQNQSSLATVTLQS